MARGLLCLLIALAFLRAGEQPKIGIYEQLGKHIDMDIPFVNSNGLKTTFRELSDGRPVVLSINYYTCPTLCSPILEGVSEVLERLDMDPYSEYQAITVSIDPKDNPVVAANKKREFLTAIRRPFPQERWAFLTGSQESIDKLTQQVGFYYETRVKDGVTDYLHPGAIITISPNGKVARYLFGTTFLQTDLKLALYEAKEERFGPTIAKTLLYCFAYDPESKSYVFQFGRIFAVLMTLTLIAFAYYLVKTSRKDKPHE